MSPSWEKRVKYAPGRVFAYRPGQILVRPRDGAELEEALRIVREIVERTAPPSSENREVDYVQRAFGYFRVDAPVDVPAAVAVLNGAGITAQPNHVLFADPFSGNPFSGNPFSGNPFSGNPFSGNPFSGNPFSGNPFSGNPFSGNPFSGNPSGTGLTGDFCYGKPLPVRDEVFARTGQGPCLARPVEHAWAQPDDVGKRWPHVAVLDVPLPGPGQLPAPLDVCGVRPVDVRGVPDEEALPPNPPAEDGRGFLDRVAGHGMFVAGRVLQADPRCEVTVLRALENSGDGDEDEISMTLESLVGNVDVVNLSFSAYALEDMGLLQAAVAALQTTAGPATTDLASDAEADLHGCVVVTSAGNDATSTAPYPAALPGVVSVAALGPQGPASFTNYGDWVSACASGLDVVSTYFTEFDGNTPPDAVGDPDRFRGAASWSGTSFAAPLVAGKIARLVREKGLLPKQAVQRLLYAPGLARLPYLGTIVTD